MPITADTLRLQERIRVAVDKITDKQTRDLVAAWADAWDEVAPDLTATLVEMLVSGDRVTKAQLLRSERLKKALVVIAEKLDALADQAGVRIVGDLQRVIDSAGGAQASVLDSQLPHNTARQVQLKQWSQVNPDAIEAIVKRSTQQIESRLQPLARETRVAVRRELIRGVAAGTSPRDTARRMVARAEARFNGDLGLTRALRIARTETLDAHRAASLVARQQNLDVLAGWVWHCQLSQRSCPACIAQHGSLHPPEEPGPFDHVNGKCTALPQTKSWKDLGFDVEEPPSLAQSGEDWFAGQSETVQRQILGPSRYDAWKGGDYPLSDWSVTRQNSGWRHSVQVSRVPRQSGGRSSSSPALAS